MLAQVQGTVTNESGEQLAFASIYLQGTTQGTTTNVEGNYAFELEEGDYTLVFQFDWNYLLLVSYILEDQGIIPFFQFKSIIVFYICRGTLSCTL